MIVLALLILLWGAVRLLDIFGDVGGWLSGRFHNLRDAVSAIWKSIKRVISWASSIFRHVGGAWQALHDAYHVVISGLERLAEGTYGTLRWLIRTEIPRIARGTIGKAIHAAINELKRLIHAARRLAESVLRFAKKEINKVRHALSSAVRWARKKINTILHWINKVGKRLAELVLHPKKLVAWILPSLVTPLLKWIFQHIGALATTIFRWLLSHLGRFAVEIERAVAKIL